MRIYSITIFYEISLRQPVVGKLVLPKKTSLHSQPLFSKSGRSNKVWAGTASYHCFFLPGGRARAHHNCLKAVVMKFIIQRWQFFLTSRSLFSKKAKEASRRGDVLILSPCCVLGRDWLLSIFWAVPAIFSSQPSMVHWLSSPIFPCSVVWLSSRYGNTRPNWHITSAVWAYNLRRLGI